MADRVAELADKSIESELPDAERVEHAAYVEANNLLVVLHAEARFQLRRDEP